MNGERMGPLRQAAGDLLQDGDILRRNGAEEPQSCEISERTGKDSADKPQAPRHHVNEGVG